MYVYVNHFAVHLKLKQWCKSTILQLKKTQSSRVCFPWTRTGPGGWSFKEWAHSGAFPAGDSTTSSVQVESEPIRCRGWRLTITWRVITFCCCRCSVAQSCPTLCNPIDCSMPGFPVHHHLTISRSLHKLMSIESVMPSNHLILCRPLLLLPSVFPSIRVFFRELALHISWPKYWSLTFRISPSSAWAQNRRSCPRMFPEGKSLQNSWRGPFEDPDAVDSKWKEGADRFQGKKPFHTWNSLDWGGEKLEQWMKFGVWAGHLT